TASRLGFRAGLSAWLSRRYDSQERYQISSRLLRSMSSNSALIACAVARIMPVMATTQSNLTSVRDTWMDWGSSAGFIEELRPACQVEYVIDPGRRHVPTSCSHPRGKI